MVGVLFDGLGEDDWQLSDGLGSLHTIQGLDMIMFDSNRLGWMIVDNDSVGVG